MTNQFPVPQESVEAGLIHSGIASMESWLNVQAFGSEDFSTHRNVYMFVQEYLQQYGNLPSPSTLSSRFADWNPPMGDFPFWLAEMKRYSLARQVLDTIKEGFDQVADPQKALSFMLERLSIIRSTNTNHIQATDAGAARRLERFDARTETIFQGHQIVGLRTGLKVIDDTRIGYIPGSLVGCYARPGVGKTWWLLWSGLHTWMDGGTVLAITPEMPANWLDLRFDVLAAHQLGRTIDYNKLMIGDPSIRTDYEWITNVVAQSQRWWTYDSLDEHAIGLGDIAALMRLHQPSQVLIDGVSLLRYQGRGQTWEQMKELCYGLKNLATVYETPILITHQANNANRGRRASETALTGRGDDFLMPSLNDAAFGDAFVQACSDVITMVGESTSPNINWYSIRKHRERGWTRPLPARMALAVDFAHGKMYDLSELGNAPEQCGREAQRVLGL